MKVKKKIINSYDLTIILIIGSIAFGVIGGGAQITRLISILLVPFNICHVINIKSKLLKEPYMILGIIWICFAIYSLHWSLDYENGLYQVLYLVIYLNLVYSLQIMGKKSSNPLKCVLLGWLLFFIISTPIGLIEIFTDSHLYTNSIQTDALNSGQTLNGIVGKKYAATTYNNYNEYMTAICFGLPYLLVAILYFSEYKSYKYLWILLTGVLIIIMVTASRGAIICAIISIVLFLLSLKKISIPNKAKLLRRIIIIVILGIILFSSFLFSQISARLEKTELAGDPGRLMIYMEAFRLIQLSNYQGLGPYGFEHIWGIAPHNLWLEIFTQYGWVVMALIFAISIDIVVKIINKFKKKHLLLLLGKMVLFTLPISTIINSSYMNYSFLWVSLGSILILIDNSYRYRSVVTYNGYSLTFK